MQDLNWHTFNGSPETLPEENAAIHVLLAYPDVKGPDGFLERIAYIETMIQGTYYNNEWHLKTVCDFNVPVQEGDSWAYKYNFKASE